MECQQLTKRNTYKTIKTGHHGRTSKIPENYKLQCYGIVSSSTLTVIKISLNDITNILNYIHLPYSHNTSNSFICYLILLKLQYHFKANCVVFEMHEFIKFKLKKNISFRHNFLQTKYALYIKVACRFQFDTYIVSCQTLIDRRSFERHKVMSSLKHLYEQKLDQINL